MNSGRERITPEQIACHMLEAKYEENLKKNGLDKGKKTIYGIEWHTCRNYGKRIQILKEAIEKNCLIEQTSLYNDIIEGVR